MVLELWHNDFLTACELLAAIRAERHQNLNGLDCLPLILKIMVVFKIFLGRYPIQVEIDFGAIFFKPYLRERASKKSSYESNFEPR